MENFIVSARKYRPTTFLSVVGQSALTNTLKNAIKSNHLAHAYLFCGPRGVGKTTCARIFAKTITCQTLSADGEACNQCESCISYNDQRSFNIHELDAASNNGVDEIKYLIDQVRIPPQVGKYSVYIIDEVHMLSQAAFNAFLKTLEEPPAHAVFILATTEKHKIIPTILSRCQIYDFNRISVADTVAHLQFVADKEGVKAEPEALNVIAQKSDGGMRDALSIFDQMVSFSEGNISYKSVIENLNVLDYEYYFKLVTGFLNNDIVTSLLIFNEILNKGFEANNFISGLSSHFRDLLVCKDAKTIPLLEVGASIGNAYKQQAESCSNDFLFDALKICNDCDMDYRLSKNKRLLVEITLIRLCQLTKKKSSDLTQEVTTAPLEKIAVTPPTAVEQPIEKEKTTTTNTIAAEKPEQEEPTAAKEKSQAINMVNEKSMSFSISQSAQKATKIIVEEKKEKNNPFTQEELLSVWSEFISSLNEKKTRLKNTLTNAVVQLVENSSEIEVEVTNSYQEQELKDDPALINFLRKKLENDFIQLKTRITEPSASPKAYTSEEKYKMMAEENPYLAELRKSLKLEIE
jgi:DNA polymerase-3 subunit gamma/tau